MKPKLSILRKILSFLSLGLLILGGYFLFEYFHLETKYQNAVIAEPFSAEVDFSRSGKYIFPFKQTYSFAHAQRIVLELPGKSKTDQMPAETLLHGLKGEYTLKDTKGKQIISEEIMEDQFRILAPNSVQIARFFPFREGQYTFFLTILKGAPKLVTAQQRLYVKYELCGLERLPGMMAGGISLFAFLVGIIMGYFSIKPYFTKDVSQAVCPEKSEPPTV